MKLTTLATIALLVGLATAAVQPAFLTTLSGRQVPASSVKARLPNHAHKHISNRLYEIKHSRYLQGADRSIDLHQLAADITQVPPSPRLSANVNGVPTNARPDGYLRMGGGYIVSHMADGDVLAVWAHRLILSPLDHIAHPGVFVNTWNERASDIHIADHMGRSKAKKAFLHVSREEPAIEMVVTGSEGKLKSKIFSIASVITSRQSDSCSNKNAERLLELAVSTDNSLCNQEYGNDQGRAITGLNNFVKAVEASYRVSTCIRIQMTHFDGHCNSPNDPYSDLDGEDALDILRGYQNIWQNDPYTSVHRDLALLITGFKDDSTVAGVAYVGAVCNQEFGFGWSEGLNTAVTIHEIGHSFNAEHSEEGIMRPIIALFNPNTTFSEVSIDQMTSFVDSDGKSCMPLVGPGGTSPPIVTTTPPTVTSQPPTLPPGAPGSCASGWMSFLGLECTEERFNKIRSSVGRVSTTVSTKFNKIYVQFDMQSFDSTEDVRGKRLTTQHRIIEHGLVLSLRRGLKADRVKSSVDGAGVRSVTVDWDLAAIDLPTNGPTCCLRRLNVYQNIKVQQAVVDEDGRVIGTPKTKVTTNVLPFAIPCLHCTRPRKLFPMTPTQECPICRT